MSESRKFNDQPRFKDEEYLRWIETLCPMVVVLENIADEIRRSARLSGYEIGTDRLDDAETAAWGVRALRVRLMRDYNAEVSDT